MNFPRFGFESSVDNDDLASAVAFSRYVAYELFVDYLINDFSSKSDYGSCVSDNATRNVEKGVTWTIEQLSTDSRLRKTTKFDFLGKKLKGQVLNHARWASSFLFFLHNSEIVDLAACSLTELAQVCLDEDATFGAYKAAVTDQRGRQMEYSTRLSYTIFYRHLLQAFSHSLLFTTGRKYTESRPTRVCPHISLSKLLFFFTLFSPSYLRGRILH